MLQCVRAPKMAKLSAVDNRFNMMTNTKPPKELHSCHLGTMCIWLVSWLPFRKLQDHLYNMQFKIDCNNIISPTCCYNQFWLQGDTLKDGTDQHSIVVRVVGAVGRSGGRLRCQGAWDLEPRTYSQPRRHSRRVQSTALGRRNLEGTATDATSTRCPPPSRTYRPVSPDAGH